jgi:hypothetical protein
MVDMMTNDNFREALLLIEHQLIGKEEFVVFLEENLKVSGSKLLGQCKFSLSKKLNGSEHQPD